MLTSERTLSLSSLFEPASVAVIGASSDPNKIGGRPIAFLKRAGYAGRIVPVNPGAAEVQGLRPAASMAVLDAPVEHAIVALPGHQVLAAVQACARAGVRAVQVFSSGVAESGAAGDAERAALRSLARSGELRLLGPNSLGVFSTPSCFFGTFATALDGAWPRPGPVGVASQSGAFGSYFFALAQARGVGFSRFVATGNEVDVDVADCIEYLATDPSTRVIVTALEGCRDGRRLARALLAAHAAGKPVLAMKVGRSAGGAAAAATHTGALSSEDRVFDAVLRDTGARRAHTLEALVDAAVLASSSPPPPSRDVLVVTTSGGIGVLSADAADEHALALPPIGDRAAHEIAALAPLGSGRNPVDTSAGIIGDLARYAAIAGHALASRPYGAVLCFLAHIGRNPAHWAQLRGPLGALRARHPSLPFAAVLTAPADVVVELEAHGFAVFDDPSRALAAIALNAPRHTRAPRIAFDAPDPALAMKRAPRDEAEARAALAALGIRFPEESHVHDADEALRAAGRLGYPVVLKVVSPDITHKTEAGGVALGIPDASTLNREIADMNERVARRAPKARRQGFIVSRHLAAGVEVRAGVHLDPVFGLVASVGAGGVLTEWLDDSVIRLAPVSTEEARAMLTEARVGALLGGFRGSPPCDLDALAQQVSRLTAIAAASSERVRALELNPVIARPEGCEAVDALAEPIGDPT
ncbi:MAG TPA: acetate--CoA ligase family protein [Caldimonas sp.]|nr:acetate--CoA ligase family protein [Caldimonas sp.]